MWSIFFSFHAFFLNYNTFVTMKKVNLAVFASGQGSNTENLIRYFANKPNIIIKCVVSNIPDAKVLEKSKKLNVETKVFANSDFKTGERVNEYLKSKNIDFIVLAGFLRLIPTVLVNSFQDKIINIHPSLLPKHGGKGMYGRAVHQAVFDTKDTQTGITIHLVNDKYDEGDYIAQFFTNINGVKSPEEIEQKVRELENAYFPSTVESFITKKV